MLAIGEIEIIEIIPIIIINYPYSPYAEPKDPLFTTTTTSTQAPPIEPSSFYKFNTNQQEPFSIPSTEDPFKRFNNFFTSTTTKPTTTKHQRKTDFHFSTKKPKTTSTTVSPTQSHTTTTTLSHRPLINSFHYGSNAKKSTTAYPFYKLFTTQNPNAFKEFEFEFETTSSTMRSPFAHSSTKPKPRTPATTTQRAPFRSALLTSTISSDHILPESVTSSTRNPIFDVYLKRVSLTTKSPYDFGNFGEYFKTTSTTLPPNDRSLNLLGANSNSAPFTENLQQK